MSLNTECNVNILICNNWIRLNRKMVKYCLYIAILYFAGKGFVTSLVLYYTRGDTSLFIFTI